MKTYSVNDLYKMSLDDLKAVTKNQINIANQNIRELEETGYATLSQAYNSLAKKQGREKPSFSTNLDDLNKPQLVHRYVSATHYNSLRTANVFGTGETNREIYEKMGIEKEKAQQMINDIALNEIRKSRNESEIVNIKETYGIDVREFWETYRKYEESEKSKVANYGSTFVQEKLREYITRPLKNGVNFGRFNNFLEKEHNVKMEQENRQEQQSIADNFGEKINV